MPSPKPHTVYFVLCPECHGLGFLTINHAFRGDTCRHCDGDGKFPMMVQVKYHDDPGRTTKKTIARRGFMSLRGRMIDREDKL